MSFNVLTNALPSTNAAEGSGFPIKPVLFMKPFTDGLETLGHIKSIWNLASVLELVIFSKIHIIFIMQFIMIMIILASFLLKFPNTSRTQMNEKFVLQKQDVNPTFMLAVNKIEISVPARF